MSGEDSTLLDLSRLEDEISKLIDRSNIQECLEKQLVEIEMIQSTFSQPGEFEIRCDVLEEVRLFVDGKIETPPQILDFVLHLSVYDIKLDINVTMPQMYPGMTPHLFVRSTDLTGLQQKDINKDISCFVNSCDKSDVYMYSAITHLLDKAATYSSVKLSPEKEISKHVVKTVFARCWIYSHHIYSQAKRKEISDASNSYNITGFCLPGKPGIICIEGSEDDCDHWWQLIKSLCWKKIMMKKKEKMECEQSKLSLFRKFVGFQQISFVNQKLHSSRGFHMDMANHHSTMCRMDICVRVPRVSI